MAGKSPQDMVKNQFATALECHRQGRLKEAETLYRQISQRVQALALKPDFVEGLINRGNILQALRRYAEAIDAYRRAVTITPSYPGALYNESLARLCLGDFETGWEQYEFRWTLKEAPQQRSFKSPKWLGGNSVVGKRLLLGGAGSGRYDPVLPLRTGPCPQRR